jgi:hypothetical protein
VSLGSFLDGSTDAPTDSYLALPILSAYPQRTRFVGHHVLYGAPHIGADADYGAAEALYVHDYVKGGSAVTIALPHTVQRIDPLGNGVLVAGDDGDGLHFSTVALDPEPQLIGTWPWPGNPAIDKDRMAVAYRHETTHSGTVAMVVHFRPAPDTARRSGMTSALFLRNEALQLEYIGSLDARPRVPADRGCGFDCRRASSRNLMLFEGDRVWAQFGFEIVEGQLVDGQVEERARATLSPPPSEVSR